MDTKSVKRDIIKNFIDAQGLNSSVEVLAALEGYLEKDHRNEVGAFFLSESGAQLIAQQVYLVGDESESDPQFLYSLTTDNPQRPRMYCLSHFSGKIRTFELVDDLGTIVSNYKYEILAYVFGSGNVVPSMIPNLSEIFLHGKYVREVGKSRFKVTAKTTSYSEVEVIADDLASAMRMARGLDGGYFTPIEGEGDWEILEAVKIN